jgi:hypothetical protein
MSCSRLNFTFYTICRFILIMSSRLRSPMCSAHHAGIVLFYLFTSKIPVDNHGYEAHQNTAFPAACYILSYHHHDSSTAIWAIAGGWARVGLKATSQSNKNMWMLSQASYKTLKSQWLIIKLCKQASKRACQLREKWISQLLWIITGNHAK